ncbi:MAG: hypothetical protein ACXWMU_06405 [Candidatus Limnocylindrales bacterium]
MIHGLIHGGLHSERGGVHLLGLGLVLKSSGSASDHSHRRQRQRDVQRGRNPLGTVRRLGLGRQAERTIVWDSAATLLGTAEVPVA